MAVFDVILLLVRILVCYLTTIYRKIVPYPAKRVDGEIVLVTGAGHGMGRLQAIAYAKLGATVIVTDINEENNDETADQIREVGGKVYSYKCDVSKKDNIAKLATEIRREIGDVSILVNNAGVINVADITTITDEKIQRTFNVNILAHFWTIREFLPAMKKKNHGHIVALASIGGLDGSPFFTDYCSSKFACVGLYHSLRRELRWQKFDGIHITCVCPFFVTTGFVKNPSTRMGFVYTPEEVVEEIMKGVLHNKPFVHLPNLHRVNLFTKAILPDAALEHVFDFINPRVDLVDMR